MLRNLAEFYTACVPRVAAAEAGFGDPENGGILGIIKEAAEKVLNQTVPSAKADSDVKEKGLIGTTKSRALTPVFAKRTFSAASEVVP